MCAGLLYDKGFGPTDIRISAVAPLKVKGIPASRRLFSRIRASGYLSARRPAAGDALFLRSSPAPEREFMDAPPCGYRMY
jgi:hypothetical protein